MDIFKVFATKKEVFGDYRFSTLPDSKGLSIRDFEAYQFDGIGIVVNGAVRGNQNAFPDYVAEVEFFIDGKKIKTMNLPLSFISRSTELFWFRQLENGEHDLTLNCLNQKDGIDINLESAVLYNNPINK